MTNVQVLKVLEDRQKLKIPCLTRGALANVVTKGVFLLQYRKNPWQMV